MYTKFAFRPRVEDEDIDRALCEHNFFKVEFGVRCCVLHHARSSETKGTAPPVEFLRTGDVWARIEMAPRRQARRQYAFPCATLGWAAVGGRLVVVRGGCSVNAVNVYEQRKLATRCTVALDCLLDR